MEGTFQCHRNQRGLIAFFSLHIRNITEEKATVKSLHRERDFNRTLLENLPGLFYVIDQAFQSVRWNRNTELITGLSEEELRELGPLGLWLRHRGDEVWMAHVPGDWTRAGRGRPRERPVEPEDADWIRWPVPEGTTELELAPALPPRPVVAEPELSFRLLPRARARVFVRVPLWVRLDALVDGEPRKLAEVPTATLSDTWWGTPTEGELCYWLSTTARREVEREVFEPNVAVCPLLLSNRSDDELPVERIALRVIHLTLFAEEDRF